MQVCTGGGRVHAGFRILLREEGVTFQRLKTWKASEDPRYAAKKVRIKQLYAIADRELVAEDGDPEVIFCVDEFGPLNLQPALGGSGPRSAAKARSPAGRCCRGCAPPAPAPPVSGTWSPLTSWRGQAAHSLPRVGPDRDHLRQL
jgi:hypothetical protein